MSIDQVNSFNTNVFGGIWDAMGQPFFMIGSFALSLKVFFLILGLGYLATYFIQRVFDYRGYD